MTQFLALFLSLFDFGVTLDTKSIVEWVLERGKLDDTVFKTLNSNLKNPR